MIIYCYYIEKVLYVLSIFNECIYFCNELIVMMVFDEVNYLIKGNLNLIF